MPKNMTEALLNLTEALPNLSIVLEGEIEFANQNSAIRDYKGQEMPQHIRNPFSEMCFGQWLYISRSLKQAALETLEAVQLNLCDGT
eukprot:695531-Amphidinium_carterae.1